jgi:hypothetical protein
VLTIGFSTDVATLHFTRKACATSIAVRHGLHASQFLPGPLTWHELSNLRTIS